MTETRRFRIPLWPVLLLLAAAAIVANLPAAWFQAQTPEARRAEVFSEFVTLGRVPDTGVLDHLTELTGQETRIRKARLARAHPAALDAYAEAIGVEAAWLREAVLDPNYAHPFDLSRFEMSAPRFARHGAGAAWNWGLATGAAGQGALPQACAQWLVFWDSEAWFFAPVGTADLNEITFGAVPGLDDVPEARFRGCERAG